MLAIECFWNETQPCNFETTVNGVRHNNSYKRTSLCMKKEFEQGLLSCFYCIVMPGPGPCIARSFSLGPIGDQSYNLTNILFSFPTSSICTVLLSNTGFFHNCRMTLLAIWNSECDCWAANLCIILKSIKIWNSNVYIKTAFFLCHS